MDQSLSRVDGRFGVVPSEIWIDTAKTPNAASAPRTPS